MARPIDYSKWKDIEISDDEDDTHPNIDTPSLFKWRHEARVKRQEEFEQKQREVEEEKQAKERKLAELKAKMGKDGDKAKSGSANSGPNLDSLKKEVAAVERERLEAERKLQEVEKEDRLRPWNVDTISKEGFNKTLFNTAASRPSNEDLSDEEREQRMREFVKANEKDMKQYGFMSKFDDSKRFLNERKHLACEETANYLVIQCINYAMEEKFALMEQVAHQTIAMQYLLELSRQLDVDPRACISSFFTKIQVADDEYKKAFLDELAAFKERIRRRAKEKVEEQMEELRKEEEAEREARLGPGGLDPAEVFESLPDVLKECFESQDIAKLQEAIRALPEEEARHHMKRCVDSGLWKPAADDPDTNPEDGFKRRQAAGDGDGDGEGEGGEAVYEEVPAAKEK